MEETYKLSIDEIEAICYGIAVEINETCEPNASQLSVLDKLDPEHKIIDKEQYDTFVSMMEKSYDNL